MAEPYAHFAGRTATGLSDVARDPAALDTGGWWAVVATFEGAWTCARFEQVEPSPLPPGRWGGVPRGAWRSSMSQESYVVAVRELREAIADGDVYQANLCRLMSAPLSADDDPSGLAGLLAAGHPAPYAGVVHLPDEGVSVVSASPELFLRREGLMLESSPIKGTATEPSGLLDKDVAENVMIVDLVRNDLGQVCATGSVEVRDLLAVEKHPGLVHLVSTVRGRMRAGTGWADIAAATFPPGSVSGAPKSSALRLIRAFEPVPRGAYCGAVGWVDADRDEACLAVGIRSFVLGDGEVRFGTGAGITWGSDPQAEWRETELKADRLLAVAARSTEGSSS